MYVRTTHRVNKDGERVSYLQLAVNVWDPVKKQATARVIYGLGRPEDVDKDGVRRLIASLSRIVLGESPPLVGAAAGPVRYTVLGARDLGGVHVARALWTELGIGEVLRGLDHPRGRHAPHAAALFAMVAHRLLAPGSKRSCHLRWLRDTTYLPEAAGLTLEHLYRAMDFLFDHGALVEQKVFERAATLLSADVDLVFFDTTSCYFEVDEEDEGKWPYKGKGLERPRKRGHNKEGRDGNPQVVVALAVTRDGVPVRSWVFPGNTVDVTMVGTIKKDLAAWTLHRVLLVGDAGMDSEENRKKLSAGLGRYILAVPAGRSSDVQKQVLSRAGRYRKVEENLEAKEVWVGDGERRRRYILCRNQQEAARQRARRERVLLELAEEISSLPRAKDDGTHTKRVCELIASKRFGRYLTQAADGSVDIDPAKVKKAGRLDGHFVITTNDDTLDASDAAAGYKAMMLIESCFRRMKTTGLRMRPVYHWTPHRIEAHVKLCVLALHIQRTAEIRAKDTWRNVSHALEPIKAVELRIGAHTIVQPTELKPEAERILASLGVAKPNDVLELRDAPSTA